MSTQYIQLRSLSICEVGDKYFFIGVAITSGPFVISWGLLLDDYVSRSLHNFHLSL